MPQSSKPRVNLVVEPELKARIDDETEGETGEYSSMADFVRTAIRHELDAGGQQTATDASETAQTTALSEERAAQLQRIEQAVDTANERLDQLQSETRASGPVYDLQKVLDNWVLPTPPESAIAPGPEGKGTTVHRDSIDEWAVTAEEIARTIDVEEDDVQTALERLSDMTGDVKSAESDGKRYWYREGSRSA